MSREVGREFPLAIAARSRVAKRWRPVLHPNSSLPAMAHASTSRWSLDYASQPSKVAVVSPPGYTPALTKVRAATPPARHSLGLTPRLHQSKGKSSQAVIKATEELSALRQQKAWDMALAPAKNVPMQGASRSTLPELGGATRR